MSDRSYTYGAHNGQTYTAIEGSDTSGKRRTHFDPRVEVSAPGHDLVQVGVVPPSFATSSDDPAWGPETVRWDPENGQFLSLDWAGCNRLIKSIREARDATFGVAE